MTASKNFQDEFFSATTDYRHGSPHLAHPPLYNHLVEVIQDQLVLLSDRGLPKDVVEIGAGHGAFTEPILAAGAALQP